MEKLYNRIDFHNGTTPALNESNLNAMSKAIDDLDNRVIKLPAVISEESVEICVEAAKRAEEVAKSIPEDYSEVSRRAESISNRNLLDNGWFTINQRGQSSYNGSASCGLDRWWQQYDTNVSVHNGYITRSGTWQIEQILDNEIEANTPYTLSALVRNYSSAESFGFKLAIGKDSTTLASNNVPKTEFVTSEWKLVSWTFNVNQNGNKVFFGGVDGKPYSIDIKAIKLEKGSISTIDNDVAPNYAEELLKCQRYYYRLRKASGRMYGVNTKAGMTAELPVKMAKVPNLVLHPINLNVYANGQNKDGTISSLDGEVYLNDNLLRFIINFSDIGASASWFTPVIIQAESQYGYIELIAE